MNDVKKRSVTTEQRKHFTEIWEYVIRLPISTNDEIHDNFGKMFKKCESYTNTWKERAVQPRKTPTAGK